MAAPIGLDIGSSAVRAAQVRQGKQGASLERIGQVLLPAGAVRDGEIVDADTVIQALRHLWKTAKLKGRKVSVGLANQQVVVRRLDLPFMTEDELRTSLPLQIDGQIPIPVDEAVLDFCYLGEGVNDAGDPTVRILAVAALKTMVDELMAVVQQAKLEPVGVDLDAFAALRSLTPPGIFADDTAEMLVDVGGTITDLVVHQNGSPHFVRTVLFGGQNVTAALAEQLDITSEDAERLKMDISDVEPAAGSDEELAADIVRAQSSRLIDELKGSIDYCAAQRDIPAIERVVLTGGASRWPGLADAMADELGLDITAGSPLHGLDTATGVDRDELSVAEPHLAVAVGLALGAQQ